MEDGVAEELEQGHIRHSPFMAITSVCGGWALRITRCPQCLSGKRVTMVLGGSPAIALWCHQLQTS